MDTLTTIARSSELQAAIAAFQVTLLAVGTVIALIQLSKGRK